MGEMISRWMICVWQRLVRLLQIVFLDLWLCVKTLHVHLDAFHNLLLNIILLNVVISWHTLIINCIQPCTRLTRILRRLPLPKWFILETLRTLVIVIYLWLVRPCSHISQIYFLCVWLHPSVRRIELLLLFWTLLHYSNI
jgi:hypothetical protein